MSALEWDVIGEHFYETGVRKGVLYVEDADGNYPKGVAWNGLTKVTEKASGGDATAVYANDGLYLNRRAVEEFEATIEAYTYPDEFAECDGSAVLSDGVYAGQQGRKRFGFCYRTALGNDTEGTEYGYKLHLLWGLTASPSERAYETIDDSPDEVSFSWDIASVPIAVSGYDPVSSMTIDSTLVSASKLAKLEAALYGADGVSGALLDSDSDYVLDSDGNTIGTDDQGTKAYLPLPSAVISMLK